VKLPENKVSAKQNLKIKTLAGFEIGISFAVLY